MTQKAVLVALSGRILCTAVFGCSLVTGLMAQETAKAQEPATAPAGPLPVMFIRQFRVQGVQEIPRTEVDAAVYPYLGPGRTAQDIEGARAALEKLYQDKGFQVASVQVPPQSGRRGVIILQVSEGKLGKVRVKGARYFLPSEIRKKAQSLAEGRAVNFQCLSQDIVALNQWSDRQVTPKILAGSEPGTVDIDLEVKDKLPLHGSLELNNRRSPDTTELRLNGGLSYTNLWQLGHTIAANFQISPEDPSEVRVLSGYYMARFPSKENFSLMFTGTKQNSNVSTLGASAVAGKGEVLGIHGVFTLPGGPEFYHSVNLGIDYKHFLQNVAVGGQTIQTPITYFPVNANYSATWARKHSTTEFNAGVNFSFRGLGSDSREFDLNRFGADGSFIYLRGDLSHSHDLPGKFQGFAKVQGQVSSQPLVNSEQFAGGGLGTVRGYLEAETLGDNAIFGSAELRTPSLLWFSSGQEWRVYTFCDAGVLTLHSPLPEQKSSFRLASVGIGTRMELFSHVSGSLDLAWPLVSQTATQTGDTRLIFRVSADF